MFLAEITGRRPAWIEVFPVQPLLASSANRVIESRIDNAARRYFELVYKILGGLIEVVTILRSW